MRKVIVVPIILTIFVMLAVLIMSNRKTVYHEFVGGWVSMAAIDPSSPTMWFYADRTGWHTSPAHGFTWYVSNRMLHINTIHTPETTERLNFNFDGDVLRVDGGRNTLVRYYTRYRRY